MQHSSFQRDLSKILSGHLLISWLFKKFPYRQQLLQGKSCISLPFFNQNFTTDVYPLGFARFLVFFFSRDHHDICKFGPLIEKKEALAPSMEDSSNGGLNNNAAMELTGKITMAFIIFLFLVVVLALLFHFYAKWFSWHVEGRPVQHQRRRLFDFAPSQEPTSGEERRGLEPSVLQSLPVVIFRPDEFKQGLDCAVCLCELEVGEKARLLPKCNHGFHVDCIDMWFQSHATCPLCRTPITGPEVSTSPDADSAESSHLDIGATSSNTSFPSGEESSVSPNISTNVLYWGNGTQVNSGNGSLEEATTPPGSTSEGMLVIDILRPEIENQTYLVSPSTSGCAQEEPKPPVMTRLRSLTRLLSPGSGRESLLLRLPLTLNKREDESLPR